MWFKKASPRRQAIRDDLAELREAAVTGRGRTRHLLFVAGVFALLASLLQFWPRNPLPYRVGENAPLDIRASVAFTFVDPVEAARARLLARENTEQVLAVDEGTVRLLGNQLIALRGNVETVNSLDKLPPEFRTRFPSLNDETLAALRATDAATWKDAVESFKEMPSGGGLRSIPVLTAEDRDALLKRRADAAPGASDSDSIVRLAPTNSVEPKSWTTVIDLDRVLTLGDHGVDPSARADIRRIVVQGGEFSLPLTDLVVDAVMGLNRPIYRYDLRLSAQLAEQRAAKYMPQGPYIAAGQIIVHRDERISESLYQELLQSQQALEYSIAEQRPWAPWLNTAGLVLTTLLLTAASAAYLLRNSAALTIRRAWAIAGLLLITLAAAKIIAVYWPFGILGIAPTLFVAIILVIAENQPVALGISALHGLLAAFTLRQGVDFYVPLLVGSAVFCFGLREIRTRGKLIEVGAAAGFAIFIAVWALGLSHLFGLAWSRWIASTDIHLTLLDSLWGAGAGVAVAMFALAILPSTERIFHITTAMTLLELCDANKPLLRRLSQEAPGTFNHSLAVGIMAEAAGNAVGANGLLCRVGAYYHDIGKLSKPQYFIENLNPGHPNRHEKLSPAMSLLIIVGHVKDGIELAREYALPLVVHQFIAQHHGTTLVEYFFHAARQRAALDGDGPQVSDTEFRYPGPKPQTAEAAIVMICDSCESLVRAIDEPTPGRIESAVHNMIMKRLLDGQFNECEITLRDLSLIEETVVRTLAGIHHGRVSYPSRPAARPADDSPPTLPLSQPA